MHAGLVLDGRGGAPKRGGDGGQWGPGRRQLSQPAEVFGGPVVAPRRTGETGGAIAGSETRQLTHSLLLHENQRGHLLYIGCSTAEDTVERKIDHGRGVERQ